mgnify:CR=1 FL=1
MLFVRPCFSLYTLQMYPPKAAYRLPEGTLVIESDGTPVLYDRSHPVAASVLDMTLPAGLNMKQKQAKLLVCVAQ